MSAFTLTSIPRVGLSSTNIGILAEPSGYHHFLLVAPGKVGDVLVYAVILTLIASAFFRAKPSSSFFVKEGASTCH